MAFWKPSSDEDLTSEGKCQVSGASGVASRYLGDFLLRAPVVVYSLISDLLSVGVFGPDKIGLISTDICI